ncbi:MAG: DUF4129 domain-containing protein [Proteobacteria bacterium]|jgi:hypothetical protein|nr:DUF4129 domain-containing protein [Pseudomonadota bacterium]
MSSEVRHIHRPARWWTEIKALIPPLGIYWGALLLGLVTFTVTILVVESNDQEDYVILTLFWMVAIGATGAGQVAALAKIRTPWVAMVTVLLFVGFFLAIYYENEFEHYTKAILGKEGPAIVGLSLLLGGFYLMCGLWSLRVHMGVFASWGPLLWVTATILIVSEKRDNDIYWHEGQKWAIWDWVTVPILLAGVAFLVLFLASKERYRLHRWAFSPKGPDSPLSQRVRGRFNPIAGCGTLLVIGVLTAVLTADSGIVAPYLWRTGPGDREGGNGNQNMPDGDMGEPDEPNGGGDPIPAEPEPGEGDPDLQQMMEQLKKAAQQTTGAICMMIGMLLLAVAALIVFGPPLRRALLVQHLRRPLWPVPPTRAVQQNWRLVEIALADAGFPRQPGESATSLAHRALKQIDIHDEPLLRSAELTDRVVYGYGMNPDDRALSKRAAEMAYQAVYELLTEAQRVKAQYRWL